MAIHGIIVAAGTGSRFGGDTPKQLVELRGMPVVAWSLRAFIKAGIESLTVVAPSEHIEAVTVAASAVAAPTVVPGGATRSESVRLGLEATGGDADDTVLVLAKERGWLSLLAKYKDQMAPKSRELLEAAFASAAADDDL